MIVQRNLKKYDTYILFNIKLQLIYKLFINIYREIVQNRLYMSKKERA
jgi:hypothetical protein